MSTPDWLVFGLYFAAVLSFAYYHSRKNEGIEGYLLANRRLPWGAIGLSVMATQASAITFIGTTGQAFDDGMEFIQVYLALPLAMVIICIFFIPFFYHSKVFTAYEYLEQRFDAKTRSLTAFLFLVSRGMGAGIIMYAPAIVLSVIMGWDETVTIMIMAVMTVSYTMMGGITAVIWDRRHPDAHDVRRDHRRPSGASQRTSCRGGRGRRGIHRRHPGHVAVHRSVLGPRPTPTRFGRAYSAACFWRWPTSAPTKARFSAT